MKVTVEVNGTTQSHDVEPRLLLVHYLRENCGLTGTNVGCDTSSCGACTIHLNGEAVKSCTLLAVQADGQRITTIEGLKQGGTLHPVQQAWLDHQVPECGYCQTGMIMAVAALLAANRRPTDADIDTGITNICRCGTYPRIRRAIHAAAAALTEKRG